jgi:hypothetical protein
MTPEQRAKTVDIYGGSFTGPSVRQRVANAIRDAENGALEAAAAMVIEMLPGNALGKVIADLILLQKHPAPSSEHDWIE